MEIEGVRDIPKHRPYQGARAQLPPGKCHSSGHTETAGTPPTYRPQTTGKGHQDGRSLW